MRTSFPSRGFDPGESGFAAPSSDPDSVTIVVKPDSERLQLLEPFPAWDGKDFTGLQVLLKASGKCTTDHISPAGPWLRYRGHLENISGNLFIGANNAFALDEPGLGVDVRDTLASWRCRTWPSAYKEAGISWVAIGDENYGEGSSREHAAMEPRFMGGRAVIVRSFARIHEANLKKQGVLALTFANPNDYERVLVDDKVDIVGLDALAPGRTVKVVLQHADGRQRRDRDHAHDVGGAHLLVHRGVGPEPSGGTAAVADAPARRAGSNASAGSRPSAAGGCSAPGC